MSWLIKTKATNGSSGENGVIQGVEYFMFAVENEASMENRGNIQRFMENMGMLKGLINYDFIQEEMGGADKSKIINKRKLEFKKLCEGLAIYFLKWINDMYWIDFSPNFAKDTCHFSGLDLIYCIDQLKPVVEIINELNKLVLNNKYSGDFGSMAVKQNLDKLTNDLKHKLKPNKY